MANRSDNPSNSSQAPTAQHSASVSFSFSRSSWHVSALVRWLHAVKCNGWKSKAWVWGIAYIISLYIYIFSHYFHISKSVYVFIISKYIDIIDISVKQIRGKSPSHSARVSRVRRIIVFGPAMPWAADSYLSQVRHLAESGSKSTKLDTFLVQSFQRCPKS